MFKEMIEEISKMPKYGLLVLQLCSHNPTGVDPEKWQWDEILEVVKKKEIIPVVDAAYLGITTGELEHDRHFIKRLNEERIFSFVAHSYSKSMGLYGERAGALHVICPNKDRADVVQGHLA